MRLYNGSTSWLLSKDHFNRVAKVNAWSTDVELLQHLTLALEGPAAEVLRDFDESSPSALDDLWKRLNHRFGHVDEAREAMRRFDSRRQSDTESLVEYETALRILYKEAWPDASSDQRDAALKRRFEDGVSSVELSQYLRLHHRSLDFAQTVEQARIYAATMDSTKPKKAVRFAKVNEPAVNLVTSSAVDLTPLVTRLEAMQSSLDQMKAEKQSPQPVSSSTQQPVQQRLTPPPQSPSQLPQQQRSTRFGGSCQWHGGPAQRPSQRNQPPPPGRFVSQAMSPTPPRQSAARASVFGPWSRGKPR